MNLRQTHPALYRLLLNNFHNHDILPAYYYSINPVREIVYMSGQPVLALKDDVLKEISSGFGINPCARYDHELCPCNMIGFRKLRGVCHSMNADEGYLTC